MQDAAASSSFDLVIQLIGVRHTERFSINNLERAAVRNAVQQGETRAVAARTGAVPVVPQTGVEQEALADPHFVLHEQRPAVGRAAIVEKAQVGRSVEVELFAPVVASQVGAEHERMAVETRHRRLQGQVVPARIAAVDVRRRHARRVLVIIVAHIVGTAPQRLGRQRYAGRDAARMGELCDAVRVHGPVGRVRQRVVGAGGQLLGTLDVIGREAPPSVAGLEQELARLFAVSSAYRAARAAGCVEFGKIQVFAVPCEYVRRHQEVAAALAVPAVAGARAAFTVTARACRHARPGQRIAVTRDHVDDAEQRARAVHGGAGAGDDSMRWTTSISTSDSLPSMAWSYRESLVRTPSIISRKRLL